MMIDMPTGIVNRQVMPVGCGRVMGDGLFLFFEPEMKGLLNAIIFVMGWVFMNLFSGLQQIWGIKDKNFHYSNLDLVFYHKISQRSPRKELCDLCGFDFVYF